jgi:hypothetical protein
MTLVLILRQRERESSKLMSYYEIEKINWERSNRKCLMVIKERILESIRGAIPDCSTVVEYLKKVDTTISLLALQRCIRALSSRGSLWRSTLEVV